LPAPTSVAGPGDVAKLGAGAFARAVGGSGP